MSLAEIAGTPKAATYAVNVPSPEYVHAVEQVRTAKKGTVISKAAVTTVTPAIPEIIPDMLGNPLGTIIDTLGGLWVGSPADKLNVIGDFIPAQQTTEAYDIAHGTVTDTKKMSDVIADVINKGSETKEGSDFWNTPTLLFTDIEVPKIELPEIPDLFGWIGDLPKYAVIAAAGLVGLLLLTRK